MSTPRRAYCTSLYGESGDSGGKLSAVRTSASRSLVRLLTGWALVLFRSLLVPDLLYAPSFFLVDAIATERDRIVSIEKFRDLTEEDQEEFVDRERNIAFATIGAFGTRL